MRAGVTINLMEQFWLIYTRGRWALSSPLIVGDGGWLMEDDGLNQCFQTNHKEKGEVILAKAIVCLMKQIDTTQQNHGNKKYLRKRECGKRRRFYFCLNVDFKEQIP